MITAARILGGGGGGVERIFLPARCCAKLFTCTASFQPQIGNEAKREEEVFVQSQ